MFLPPSRSRTRTRTSKARPIRGGRCDATASFAAAHGPPHCALARSAAGLEKILSPGERRNGTADTSTPALCSPRTGARTRARTLFDALARLALQRRFAAASHSGKRAHASGENVLRRAVGSTRISGPVFGTGGLASSPPGRVVGLGAGLAEGSLRARPGLAVEVQTAENRHVNQLCPRSLPPSQTRTRTLA